jgi:hypothetical protein
MEMLVFVFGPVFLQNFHHGSDGCVLLLHGSLVLQTEKGGITGSRT